MRGHEFAKRIENESSRNADRNVEGEARQRHDGERRNRFQIVFEINLPDVKIAPWTG